MNLVKIIFSILLAIVLFISVGCGEKEPEIKTYTVTFVANGEVIESQPVNEGEAAIAPTVNIEGFEFKGWDINFQSVTSDITVNAILEKTILTVTFLDKDGDVYVTTEVEYGDSCSYPEEIVVNGFVFDKWDTDLTKVTENLTVSPIYKKEYKLSFYDGNSKINLNIDSYIEGEEVILPNTTKAGCEFLGWYLSPLSTTSYEKVDSSMSGDLKFYAKFVEVVNLNPIILPKAPYHFTNIKSVLHSSGTFYVFQPVMPTELAGKGATSFDWSTSDNNIATVSAYSSITAKQAGYCILTAVLKTDPSVICNCIIKVTSDGVFFSSEQEANKFEICKVTFIGKDGETIKTAKCLKGGAVTYPEAPLYDGFKFTGWDKQNYNITEDTTITANYELGINNYAGKSFTIIGDSISTYQGYIPAGFAAFYPYPTSDVIDVNRTWWMQVINKVGGSLFLNNSYSGTCVADSSTNATENLSRLKYGILSGQAADVIIIYMGSNDCASKYVTLDAFTKGYKKMLDNLQTIAPNSEIILCTLATSPFYTNENRISYNEVIENYGNQYNLKVIDLTSVNLSNHLVDSAHPNTSGMNLIAEKIVSDLLKE